MAIKIRDLINCNIIIKVIEKLPDEFYTKDVSNDDLMLKGHPGLVNHSHYHAFIGKYLKNFLRDLNGNLLLKELRSGGSKGSLWKKVNSIFNNSTIDKTIHEIQHKSIEPDKIVRKGHFDILRFMETNQFKKIKNIFESYEEIGGVYFRPVDGKITVLDLHKDSPKPRIGVGRDPYINSRSMPENIKTSMTDRINYLLSKRKEISTINYENKLESDLIREAQYNKLIMPGIPDHIRFIHSQWRIESPDKSSHSFIDIAAIDIKNKKLNILELKAKHDNSAFHQVKEYIDYFKRNCKQLIPFFHQLSRIMGMLYGCQELEDLEDISVSDVGLVAWPDYMGNLQLQNLNEYESSFKNTFHLSKTNKDVDFNKENINTENTELSITEEIDIGPQCSSDSVFKARMRYLQSKYRANVLKVPYGTGPNEKDNKKFGNMLTKVDGEKGLNFLSSEIFNVVKKRISESSGAVDPFRLLNNMLTSQALCFNLFGIMVDNLKLATDFWNFHFPENIKEITSVKFEYSPNPASNYLNDRTAFDVYFEYLNFYRKKGFIGVEVKYTEPFSQKIYDTPNYRKWSDDSNSPWKKKYSDQLSNITWNQLWRDHLLVISILKKNNLLYEEGFLVLVNHQEDIVCGQVVNKYKTFIKENDKTFFEIPLDKIILAFDILSNSDEIRKWLERFRKRYDL